MFYWILVCNIWFTIFLIAFIQIDASPDEKCIQSNDCADRHDGFYASCNNCTQYFLCYNDGYSKTKECPVGKEWDNHQKYCVNGKSSTCVLHGDSGENTVETGTDAVTSSTTETSFIPPGTTTESSFIPPGTTTKSSFNKPNGIHNTQMNMPVNDTLLDNNDDTRMCPRTELGIDCIYLIALSALGGFLPIIPLLLCWNHCTKKKMVTTFTQTRVGNDNRYVESIYDDISVVTDNYIRYQPMPYAVSNYRPYQAIQPTQPPDLPTQESNIGEGNVYLELVGYNYLQTQEMNVKSEIDKTLAPMVVQLCHKYKNDPSEYQTVLEQLHKIFDESSKGKSPLEMVIDDLYAGSKYSGYLVPLSERQPQNE